jgi:hypothetical protein
MKSLRMFGPLVLAFWIIRALLDTSDTTTMLALFTTLLFAPLGVYVMTRRLEQALKAHLWS